VDQSFQGPWASGRIVFAQCWQEVAPTVNLLTVYSYEDDQLGDTDQFRTVGSRRENEKSGKNDFHVSLLIAPNPHRTMCSELMPTASARLRMDWKGSGQSADDNGPRTDGTCHAGLFQVLMSISDQSCLSFLGQTCEPSIIKH
jgi:hypothetical protein